MNFIPRTPVAVQGHVFQACFWILCLARTADGRMTTDPERGPIEGRGLFRERYGFDELDRLEVDIGRHADITHARPGDRLSLDDARVFEVAAVAPGEGGRIVLELARA